MATYTPVRISGPETYRLADMHGVVRDLEWLVTLCDRILRYKARGPRPDSTEMEALEAAALIRYGRCFKRGARTAFVLDAQWLARLPQELQDAHRDFEALRDKHVAHSVNDWELNIPVAYLLQDEEKGRCEVSRVSVQNHRIIGQNPESIDQLKRLAEGLLAMIDVEFKAEAARVLSIVKQLPIAELEARLKDPAIRTGVRQLDNPRGR